MKGYALADETGDSRRAEELQRKIAEARQKALEEELQRIDAETMRRADATLQNYRVREEQTHQQRLQEAAENRRRDESAIQKRESELYAIFDEERRKKIEARKREEEEKRRALEEERRRQEEMARLKAEEEERIRREEERKREEEAELQRIEAERKRREEEALRFELDRQRREEERRRQEEERQERIRNQIHEAQTYFDNGEYEHALVEVAKALVNDPANEQALGLDSKIREILRSGKEAPPAEDQPKPQPKKIRRPVVRTDEKPPRKNTLLVGMVAAGAIIILIAVILLFRRQMFTDDFRLAVLPWTTQSQTDDEKVLGTGLAMETAEKLDRLTSVSLLGFSSSYNLFRSHPDAQREMYELGYHYQLRGTFTRNEQHTTVNIMVVDSSGKVAWTNTYDRPPALLSGLSDDIAVQLVQAMRITHPDSWTEPGSRLPVEVYESYLRGKSALLTRTEASQEAALEYFRTALRTNPTYAPALAGAADALMNVYEEGLNDADTILSHAGQYAQSAVEADSLLPEASYELGRVLAQRSKMNEAISEFDRALRNNPNLSVCLMEKAKVLFRTGQFAAATEALQRASDLDPRNPEINRAFALVYQAARSAGRSMHYHELAMLVDPDSNQYITTALTEAVTGDAELRLREGHRIVTACYRRLQEVPGDYNALYCLARLRQVTGNSEAESLLRTLQRMLQAEIQQSPKDSKALMVMAKTMVRLGRFPEATDYARRAMAIDTGDAEMRYQVAQVYAMQMYSVKKKGIDQQQKDMALNELRRALSRSYRLEQITNADFYNMFDQPEFQAAIQQTAPQR